MQKIDIPNSYPIEIAIPDISSYATGNTGIPYIWTFEAPNPGPHVMISAIVHGNEPAGAVALDWLLQNEIRPIAGRITLAFMNIAAYEAFSIEDPNASRWFEEDLNRVWDPAVLDGERTSVELNRAREVRPILDDVDYLLDIHTMQHLAPPLMMTGRHERAMGLAAAVNIPERVVADFGHMSGRRMRDYGAFDDPTSHRTALLIECGQHWHFSAGYLARESALRFLVALKSVEANLVERFSDVLPRQQFYSVVETVTIANENFQFSKKFTGGEIIQKAGTIIGYDGDKTIVTPEDDTMLVMPSRRLRPGLTAVRLATRVSDSIAHTPLSSWWY